MKILKPYNNDVRKGDLNPGIDIATKDVITFAGGVVTDIGKDVSGRIAITIQFDSTCSLRYMNLTSTRLTLGDKVRKGESIGTTNPRLHFERLSAVQGDSTHPVRIGSMTHYKVDPTSIVTGAEVIDNSDIWYARLTLSVAHPASQISICPPPPNDEDMDGAGSAGEYLEELAKEGRQP